MQITKFCINSKSKFTFVEKLLLFSDKFYQ